MENTKSPFTGAPPRPDALVGMKDSDFKPHTWEDAKQIIGQSPSVIQFVATFLGPWIYLFDPCVLILTLLQLLTDWIFSIDGLRMQADTQNGLPRRDKFTAQ